MSILIVLTSVLLLGCNTSDPAPAGSDSESKNAMPDNNEKDQKPTESPKFGTYKGKITAEGDAVIDLSGVEFVVSAAEKDKEYLYGDKYDLTGESFVVVTDEKGEFSFDKPSEYFYISPKLNTLPEGYGFNKAELVVKPDSNDYEGKCVPIHRVKAQVSGRQIAVYFEDKYGVKLNVYHSVEVDAAEEFSLEIDDLKSLEAIDVKVKVSFGERTEEISKEITFYPNVTDKLYDLCRLGIITEEEKINGFCDIVLEHSEDTDISATGLVGDIYRFYLNSENISEELKARIENNFDVEKYLDFEGDIIVD